MPKQVQEVHSLHCLNNKWVQTLQSLSLSKYSLNPSAVFKNQCLVIFQLHLFHKEDMCTKTTFGIRDYNIWELDDDHKIGGDVY